jgi:hypothetical protein
MRKLQTIIVTLALGLSACSKAQQPQPNEAQIQTALAHQAWLQGYQRRTENILQMATEARDMADAIRVSKTAREMFADIQQEWERATLEAKLRGQPQLDYNQWVKATGLLPYMQAAMTASLEAGKAQSDAMAKAVKR